MSSSVSQSKRAVPRGTKLADLKRRLGVEFDPAVDEFWVVAAAIHGLRMERGKADTDLVNRSSGLWAALEVDPEVALAVAEGELSLKNFGEVLQLVDVDASSLASARGFGDAEVSRPAAAATRENALGVDDTLAGALTSYVEASPPGRPLRVVDLALAILESTSRPGGLLPGRLSRIGAVVPAAVDSLRRCMDSSVYGFSRSVRKVRSDLGPDLEVRAGELVAQLLSHHPYAGSGVAPDVDQEAGDSDSVDGWLVQVREAYAASDVAASSRGIIDGELTIRALVDMNPGLRARLEADARVATWLEGIRPVPRMDSRTYPSVDEPAMVDLLGRQALASAIVDFIADISKGERPASLLAHLDAPWGEGKSSLLKFIEEESDECFHTVEVNAWREQRVGTQWWTLYRALRWAERTRSKNPIVKIWNYAVNLKDVLVVRRDRLWPVLITVALVVGALSVAAWRFGIKPEKLGIGNVVSTFSALAVVFAAVTALYKFLTPTSARDAKALMETSGNPMNEVRALFARSLRRSRLPVLFLIDDLDRCEPQYVIQFLEVVHTLVRDAQPQKVRRKVQEEKKKPAWMTRPGWMPRQKDVKGPYAVIAADGRWLRLCYQKHYSQMMEDDSPGMPLGYAFLDKLFQMHIRLPNVEPQLKQQYYESLLFPDRQSTRPRAADEARADDLESEVKAIRTIEAASELNHRVDGVADLGRRTEIRRELVKQLVKRESRQHQLHELAPFCGLLDSNPRTIRLFVNAVSLQAATRLIEGAPIELGPLALWAITERRWPALAEHLRSYPDDVRGAFDQAVPSKTDASDPPVPSENGASDPSVRSETLPKELAALLRSSAVQKVLLDERWGPGRRLNAELIRATTGTTDSRPSSDSRGSAG